MATNFPSSQDSFTNPTTSDTLATVSHSGQHADANDAIEAIELALLDGAPLHIDAANERVGVGTTSPVDPLHVIGDVTIEVSDGGSAAQPEVTLHRGSTTPANGDYLGQVKFSGENDNGQTVNYAKITGKISDVTDGTEDGLIEIANIKDGSQSIGYRFTSSDLKLLNGRGLEVDGDMTVDTNTLHVDSTNDRVGVGTASPTARFEVSGAALFDNVYSESSHNWNFGQLQLTREASNTPNSKIVSVMLDGDTNSSTDLYSNVNFILRTDSSPTTGSTSTGLNAGLEITAPDSVRLGTGSAERMRIDSSGNVGINDSTPSYTLDVNGDINATGKLRLNGTAVGDMINYTPALNFCSLGNGSYVARYAKIDNLVYWEFYLIVGSTTTISNGFRPSLPFTASTVSYNHSMYGKVYARDAAVGTVWHGAWYLQENGANARPAFYPDHSSGTLRGLSTLSATFPKTWGNYDTIYMSGSYLT